ncbi:restriction endonuclease subunit S [Hominenteromicrobium sp.]|uniref:restriction endonuclease subunit S n=1 Tax=Hominenteromicrobium sp. TaxID=3073581 RepID=UPI003991267D
MSKTEIPSIRFHGFDDAWEQRKVSELFRVTRGYVLAATQTETTKTDEKPYPVYSSQTKDKGLMGYYKDYLYEDAITWTTDGANAGTVNYRAGKFYCTNVCGVLLSNEVKANQMIAEALDSVAKGYVSYVGNPKLMNNVMADIVIQIPTQAEEREQLSSFFAKLDNLITLHQRKFEKLTNVKKSMLKKMFPQNGSSYPEIRFKGFTDPWEQRKAIDIADYSKGNGYSKGDLTDAGTPIILYGRLYTKYQFAISEVDTFAVPRNGAVYSQGNEVIVPASGETAEDIARASAVEKSGVLLGGDLNILRPFDFINPLFLALAISNGEPQKELAKKAQGKSVVHIHNTDIQEVTIAYPSRTEQDRIVSVFCQLDHLITLHQRELEKLQSIKKALLEKMFV